MTLTDDFSTNRGIYKSVGRFRVKEFKFDGEEALAVLEFTAGREDWAHRRCEIAVSQETFTDLGIAILADSLPAGKEKDYLHQVHKAVYALANVHGCYTELFQPPSPDQDNDVATVQGLVDQIDEFRKALAPLCVEPPAKHLLSSIVKITSGRALDRKAALGPA